MVCRDIGNETSEGIEMKLSEMIELAQAEMAEHGDLDVTVYIDDSEVPLTGFSVLMDHEDKPIRILCCDDTLLDAFAGADDHEPRFI